MTIYYDFLNNLATIVWVCFLNVNIIRRVAALSNFTYMSVRCDVIGSITPMSVSLQLMRADRPGH